MKLTRCAACGDVSGHDAGFSGCTAADVRDSGGTCRVMFIIHRRAPLPCPVIHGFVRVPRAVFLSVLS